MSQSVRNAIALLCAGIALAVAPARAAAQAQAPDTLPPLEEPPISAPDAPIVVPTTAEPAAQVTVIKGPSKQTKRANEPIRAQRRLALLGEVGWNGIAGFGPTLTYHLHPHFSLDFGAGLSLLGFKTGGRARYNFSLGRVTPFIGVGGMHAGGFSDAPITINEGDPDPNRELVNIKIHPSGWFQAVAGVDWVAPSGFTLVGAAGYAWLLSKDPVEVTSGTPNEDEKKAFDVLFRSNVVITVALGYSFR